MENNQQSSGKAVASLVLGIISIVSSFMGSFALIGIILAIIGIILGVSARKTNPSGMATAGFVLSIIGLIFTSIIFLACAACLGALSSI